MIYNKLIVIFKINPDIEDVVDAGTYDVEYNNVVIMFSGNYFIINKHMGDGEVVESEIYPLNKIVSYRTERNVD